VTLLTPDAEGAATLVGELLLQATVSAIAITTHAMVQGYVRPPMSFVQVSHDIMARHSADTVPYYSRASLSEAFRTFCHSRD
jgi:hypothetical protein